MYSDQGNPQAAKLTDVDNYVSSTFWIFYMIFGLGCIIFFFIGVCALLCCCRQRFRGIERKGYVIRDADQGAPLIMPTAAAGSILIAPGTVPGPSAPYPTLPPNSPPAIPPAYELPPKY